MIKKITLLVALGPMIGIAQAQTSVTLAGTVDGGVRYSNTAAGSLVSMNSNGLFTSNKLDFIGKEDLGDGYNAHFLLETGFNLGNGALDNANSLLFNRGAYVGLGGWFGSVDFGRQYTIAHDVIYDYDPFNFEYPGIIPLTPATDGTRFNNDAKYTGTFGPLRIRADNSFGGVAGDFNSASARGAGAQYQWGPVNFGGAYIYRTVLVGTTYQADNYYTLGTAITFGALRFAGGFMNENQDNAAPVRNLKTLNYWAGLTYDFSAFTRVGAGYYVTDLPNSNAKKDLGLVSISYSLSALTRLYAEVDYTKFSGTYITNLALNSTGQPRQIAFSVGVNHSF